MQWAQMDAQEIAPECEEELYYSGDLLSHTHKSMGPDRINPKILKQLLEGSPSLCPSFIISPGKLEGPRQLEAGQCDAHPQQGPEGRSRELQACQSDPGNQEGYGTEHLQCNQDNQGLRQPSQHGFRKDRSFLTNLFSFYDQVAQLVDGGKAVAVSASTPAKPLTLYPTAHSWRSWQRMAWTGAPFTGLRTGCMARPREWW